MPQNLRFIRPAFVPEPQVFSFSEDTAVYLSNTLPFVLRCGVDALDAERIARDLLPAWFGIRPDLQVEQSPFIARDLAAGSVTDEAYRLHVAPEGIRIEAAAPEGVRHALKTLRQASVPVPGTAVLEGYCSPAMDVEDAPFLAFRGVHLCWFPETPPPFIERMIRLAASYKYNYVVLEPWGTFRSETHPWFGWPDAPMTHAEIGRLVGIARGLGVMLVPQLNVFGHASGSRVLSGKHASLDFHPELQPLFEPDGGWNWCLSNPNTLRALSDVALELFEAFGHPPFFHIGCDEASPPSCPLCRSVPYHSLFETQVRRFHDLFAERGCRVMMWHDMLLHKDDPRWTGFVANATDDSETLADTLPKDIVVCDWYYGPPREDGDYPTLRHFREKGFPVVTCPWENEDGVRAQGAFARENRLFGFLSTTWHHLNCRNLLCEFPLAAKAAWGTANADSGAKGPARDSGLLMLSSDIRRVGWDMGVRFYEDTGFDMRQVADRITRMD